MTKIRNYRKKTKSKENEVENRQKTRVQTWRDNFMCVRIKKKQELLKKIKERGWND